MSFCIPYSGGRLTLTGGWDLVASKSTSRTVLVLSDPAGAGMFWSPSGSSGTDEGVPFSLAGSPGSYEFRNPAPSTAIYVRGPAGAICTVVTA